MKKSKMFHVFEKYSKLLIALSEKKDGTMKLLPNISLDHPNLKNREIYLRKTGIPLSRLIGAEIIHKNNVLIVSRKDAGKMAKEADGLITNEKNSFLSVTAADCLPIFLFEPGKEIVGMIHAGWRSLAENILANAIEKILGLGGEPENILVGIGPAICQKHYKVGPEVAEKFAKYPEALKKAKNKIYLDIKKIAELQLLELGLEEKNIEISPECTFELTEKYFSARRDKPDEVEAMIAVIGLHS